MNTHRTIAVEVRDHGSGPEFAVVERIGQYVENVLRTYPLTASPAAVHLVAELIRADIATPERDCFCAYEATPAMCPEHGFVR